MRGLIALKSLTESIKNLRCTRYIENTLAPRLDGAICKPERLNQGVEHSIHRKVDMYSIQGLPDGFTLQTTSLDIAVNNVQAYILHDDYFDSLDAKSLYHAALEWIIKA